MKCPNCGNEIMEGNNACANCGFIVNQNIPTPPVNTVNNDVNDTVVNSNVNMSTDNTNTNNVVSNVSDTVVNSNVNMSTDNAVNTVSNDVNPVVNNVNDTIVNSNVNMSSDDAVSNNTNNVVNEINNTAVNTNVGDKPKEKKNNTFIIVVICLVIVIIVLLILVLNKKGFFGGNESNRVVEDNTLDNTTTTINNNTVDMYGYEVEIPNGTYYKYDEESNAYVITDRANFVYNYAIGYDDFEYYVENPDILESIYESLDVSVTNSEEKTVNGIKFLLYTVSFQDNSEYEAIYSYVAKIDDYIISTGYICLYDENYISNVLNYISTMNSSVQTDSAFSKDEKTDEHSIKDYLKYYSFDMEGAS